MRTLLLLLLSFTTALAQQRIEVPNEDGRIGEVYVTVKETSTYSLIASSPIFPVVKLVYRGENNINMVLLGDGYTASQQDRFITHCLAFRKKLFSTPPFDIDSNKFNIYCIEVVSQDSGAKHPNTAVDCATANPPVPVSNPVNALGSTFDYGTTHRLLYATNTSFIRDILNTNTPQYKAAIILCNTPYYGGSGGTYAEYAAGNSSSAEIGIHELGHSLYGLGDEYSGGYCGGSERPNVTQETNPAQVKWNELFTPNIPIPTPNSTNCGTYPFLNIGLYQGANYCSTGWYRPACNCKMNMLGLPFCKVCYNHIREVNRQLVPDIANPCLVTAPKEVNVESTAKKRIVKGLKVSWSEENNITYRIQYRELGNDEWIAKPNRHSTSLISGLEAGIIYEVRVGATCKGSNKYKYSPIIQCKVR